MFPDYYTYVGNREIFQWIEKELNQAEDKLSRFNHIDDNSMSIRCQNEDECPSGSYCASGFCFERSTVSSKDPMRPNPACPEETPCKGRRDSRCSQPRCNSYGDSCWCETGTRRNRRAGLDGDGGEEEEAGGEYDFVEGDPEDWEISCASDTDCPDQWYCAYQVRNKRLNNIF